MKIAIIGLGYVGLPLCLQFARSGVSVLGVDVDARKVAALNAGRSYIRHIPSAGIKKFTGAKRFAATADFARLREVELAVIGQSTTRNFFERFLGPR